MAKGVVFPVMLTPLQRSRPPPMSFPWLMNTSPGHPAAQVDEYVVERFRRSRLSPTGTRSSPLTRPSPAGLGFTAQVRDEPATHADVCFHDVECGCQPRP